MAVDWDGEDIGESRAVPEVQEFGLDQFIKAHVDSIAALLLLLHRVADSEVLNTFCHLTGLGHMTTFVGHLSVGK